VAGRTTELPAVITDGSLQKPRMLGAPRSPTMAWSVFRYPHRSILARPSRTPNVMESKCSGSSQTEARDKLAREDYERDRRGEGKGWPITLVFTMVS